MLKTPTLDLDCCSQLANVDRLQGLAGLGVLQTLTLRLRDCNQLVESKTRIVAPSGFTRRTLYRST